MAKDSKVGDTSKIKDDEFSARAKRDILNDRPAEDYKIEKGKNK